MIGQVLQPRLDSPIIFAGHEHEGVGIADPGGKGLQRVRRLARRMFLVHAVQHRQADRLRVDQLDIMPALRQLGDGIVGEADAGTIPAIGAVENENSHDAG